MHIDCCMQWAWVIFDLSGMQFAYRHSENDSRNACLLAVASIILLPRPSSTATSLQSISIVTCFSTALACHPSLLAPRILITLTRLLMNELRLRPKLHCEKCSLDAWNRYLYNRYECSCWINIFRGYFILLLLNVIFKDIFGSFFSNISNIDTQITLETVYRPLISKLLIRGKI